MDHISVASFLRTADFAGLKIGDSLESVESRIGCSKNTGTVLSGCQYFLYGNERLQLYYDHRKLVLIGVYIHDTVPGDTVCVVAGTSVIFDVPRYATQGRDFCARWLSEAGSTYTFQYSLPDSALIEVSGGASVAIRENGQWESVQFAGPRSTATC